MRKERVKIRKMLSQEGEACKVDAMRAGTEKELRSAVPGGIRRNGRTTTKKATTRKTKRGVKELNKGEEK